jgi:transposase
MDVIVDRCAGLDVHKDTVMAAVRSPGGSGRRAEVVREFSTFTADLVRLRDWLAEAGVSQVVMEATGVYWRPVWHVLEEHGRYELLLVNARHVKNLPGRKTDVGDASWLAQLLECGLLRGSFVPTQDMARLRDLTRYRTKLIQERTREIQRVQKLLEDAPLTELREEMGRSGGPGPGWVAMFPACDRARRCHAGPVEVGGCSARHALLDG